MPELIAPLEQLVKSDVALSLVGTIDVQTIRVGFGQIDEEGNIMGYHIGPDQGHLDFTYLKGKARGGSPLVELITRSKLGFTIIGLESGDIYALHYTNKSLPSEIAYQNVSKIDYLTRLRELKRHCLKQ